MSPTPQVGAYDGIVGIEEPVIRVVETALRTRSLTPWQMATMARAGAADFGFAASWSQILQPYAQNGIPQTEMGQLEWEVWRDMFYETFAAEFAAFCKSFDNQPTKFLHLKAMFVPKDEPLYWMVSPDVLVCQLLKAGQFAFVTGAPGAGKTDYVFGGIAEPLGRLWLNLVDHRKHPELGPSRLQRVVTSLSRRPALDPAQQMLGMEEGSDDDGESHTGLPQFQKRDMLRAKDFRVLTNTPFGKDHWLSPYLRYCPSLSAFHLESDQSALDRAYNAQLWDEYGSASDRGANTKRKRDLERYGRRVRKNWGSLVYVSQSDGDLTDWVQEWLETRIELKEDHSMIVSINRTPYNFKRILGVWRTTVPYNTASRSPITIDIQEDDYADAMGEIEASIGFDDPERNEREIHLASIKWVKEHIEREAAAKQEEALKARPERRSRARYESDDSDGQPA